MSASAGDVRRTRATKAIPDQIESSHRESLRFTELEHVLIEKVEQLFWNML